MLIMFTGCSCLCSYLWLWSCSLCPTTSDQCSFFSSHSMPQSLICVCFFKIVGAKDPFHLSYSCSSLLLIKFMALLTMFLLLCFLTDILNGQILLHIMVMFLPIHHFVYGLLMFVILLFVFLFMILLFSHDLFLHIHVHSFYHKKDVTLL